LDLLNAKETTSLHFPISRLNSEYVLLDLPLITILETKFTKFMFRGCYASCINNCRGKLSGEHVISQSILGEMMTTNYLPKPIGRGSFKTKILCEGHNHDLSPFDDEVLKYTRLIHEDSLLYDPIIKGTLDSAITLPKYYTIDGKKFERWVIKTYINYKVAMDGKKKANFDFLYICNRLYKQAEFEFPYGLLKFDNKEQYTDRNAGMGEFIYEEDIDGICGITVNLQGQIYFFLLPTENTHLLMQYGVELNEKRYFIRKHIPSEREEEIYGTPTLIWHPGGIRTSQKGNTGKEVERSILNFDWTL
jgi:hypothetical protein